MEINNNIQTNKLKRGRPAKYSSEEERTNSRREYERIYKKEYNAKHPELRQKYNKTYYLKRTKINVI